MFLLHLQVGASSMQGWRVSQEDDHNAILDYGDESAYFAVYDGHGGHEVARYVADKLPNFIQNRKDFSFGADDAAMTKTLQGGMFDRQCDSRYAKYWCFSTHLGIPSL